MEISTETKYYGLESLLFSWIGMRESFPDGYMYWYCITIVPIGQYAAGSYFRSIYLDVTQSKLVMNGYNCRDDSDKEDESYEVMLKLCLV